MNAEHALSTFDTCDWQWLSTQSLQVALFEPLDGGFLQLGAPLLLLLLLHATTAAMAADAANPTKTEILMVFLLLRGRRRWKALPASSAAALDARGRRMTQLLPRRQHPRPPAPAAARHAQRLASASANFVS